MAWAWVEGVDEETKIGEERKKQEEREKEERNPLLEQCKALI